MSETTDNINDKSTEEVVIDLNGPKTLSSANESNTKDNTNETVAKFEPTVIPAKRIDELTDADKKILIDNARKGIDNPYFDVKLFKNGNTRICKKKKPTVSNQAVISNGERTVKNQSGEQKVYMTDNQLIWEHLFELETKYNNLYRKHKKLKSRYNDLYIEDEPVNIPRAELEPLSGITANDRVVEKANVDEPKDKPVQHEHEPVQKEQVQQPQKSYLPLRGGNWRASLMQNKNFYIN